MRILFCLLLTACFKPSLFGSTLKTNSGDTLFMVIGMKETDESSINSVKTKLEANTNCKVLTFCKNLGVFVLMYTNNDNKSDIDLFSETLKEVGSGINLYLKEGKVKDILSSCYIPESSMTAELKNLLAN